MFDQLDEDSWAVILQYVELKDQLSLMQVSEEMDIVVKNHWKSIKEAHMDEDIFKEFKEKPNEMHRFLQLACESLERLSMKSEYVDALLPSWTPYDFPQLLSLHCKTWDLHMNNDKLTLLLSKLFPNLTKLYLDSSNHGHYIWNFTQLQELTLHSSTLDTLTLDKIFDSLSLRKLSLFPFCTSHVGDFSLIYKCRTLEQLLIHDYNLRYDLLKNLLSLPRFYRLSFYTREYYENYMRNLKELNAELRVRHLIFNKCSWYFFGVSWYTVRFANLRRLVIQFDDICKQELYTICSGLKLLEELHLIDIQSFPSAKDMWNMVGACRSLKVLNISHNELDEHFLDESSSCLYRVLKRRNTESSAVSFYVHQTRLACNPLETLGALVHPYLIVSFDPYPIKSLANTSDAFIETEFYKIDQQT